MKKKIMIISVGKIYGGIEKYTLDLIDNLDTDKYDIFLAVRYNGLLKKHINNKKITVVELNLDKNHLLQSMFFLKKYIRKKSIEIIHCNSNNGLLVALACPKKKKLAVIHGDVEIDHANSRKIIRLFYRYIETILIKSAEECITVSESLKKIIRVRIGKKYNIKVIYNGISIVHYSKKQKYNDQKIKICCVGNLLASKGQIILLQALKELNKRGYANYICDFYGEGPELDKLKIFIEDNHIQNVYFKGFDANVRSKLNNYSICVQPSIYESFGISILECMNASCCVIASNIGGIPEIINDGVDGLLYEAGNYEQLAECLIYCFDNRDVMEKLATSGYKKVIAKFSVKNMINKYEDLYKELLYKKNSKNIQ